ncbi:TonB-dependent receptor plug domain-containing protein [Novosphingobium sp. ST904]|uniref:TonB-dependent siderophore receptor n=1 Tax=Novosphingobium sp. ST904 TaxID=1684385 RepID=UPI000A87DB9F|nr:TonB-dependent receptor plug domain-containing protein [Novosphingobium sp. ST904]TCM38783.1 TonB-dependent receptor-like protein [Novosphingobium sp. ST904]
MSVRAKIRACCSLSSVLAISLLTAANAHAAAATEETAPDAAVTEGPDPDAIVVTGATETTGLSLSSRETPQSVTVIDSERMQEQGLYDISEVLEQIVGIQTNRSSALGTDGTNYTARGFEVKNYLVDGVARPSNLYGFTEDTADMIAYERIEVIRGSAGMMTGTGQPSAAINMIRKRPGETTRASVSATLGSWDMYRLEGDLGGAVTSDGHVRARVAGAWQDNQTFIDREHAKRQALYGVVEADLGPNTLLTAGVEYQNFRNEGASRGGVPLYFTDGTRTHFSRSTNGGANWSDFSRKSVNLFASVAHDFSPNWHLQVDAEHKSGSYDETIGYFFGTAIDKDTGLGGTLYSTRWASDLTLDAIYANLRGTFEAFGQEQHVALRSATPSSTTTRPPTPAGGMAATT